MRIADVTYAPTWPEMTYVASVIDVYSRRILGRRAASSIKTALVLDALEMAIWDRSRHGLPGSDQDPDALGSFPMRGAPTSGMVSS